MLVHGFVENAVKHGIRNMENGKIEIIVERRKKECSIVILDNGVGREHSRTHKTYGTGKGLSIIDTIINGYNSLRNTTISYVINDLTDSNGNPCGTEVKITIPSKKL
jgi:LytS/YehU family sensor histidine kinase